MDSVAISTTCVMNILDLSHNPIEDKGVKCILNKMMQSRRRLVYKLNIAGIRMGVEAANVVKLAVETYDIPYVIPYCICVSIDDDNRKVAGILEGVEKWERDLKPSRAAILRLSR